LADIDPKAFADWICYRKGSAPDIGGEWYRYDPSDIFATNYHDHAPNHHTRRRADVSIYPDGRWRVTLSHGPDQIFRSGIAHDCAKALAVTLAMRADWLAGADCEQPGCAYCGWDRVQANPYTDLSAPRRRYIRLSRHCSFEVSDTIPTPRGT